jgi:hypothetical protein
MTNRLNNKKQGGYIIILNTLLFISIVIVIIIGVVNIVLAHFASTKGSISSKQSYISANSAIEEALYRLKTGKNIGPSLNISLNSNITNVTIENTQNGKKISTNAQVNGYQRKLQIDLSLGTGIAFHYGIQSGRGGFVMQNRSSVTGNVFSNGTITGAGNYIYGDAISAEATGSIDGIHATGTAYAHTIRNSTIEKKAFYKTISNTDVGGSPCPNVNCFPNSADLPEASMPISDTQIAEWEDQASNGDIIVCTSGKYTIESDEDIGPAKIPCDLYIKGNGVTMTMSGPVWVVGNIYTQTGPIIKINPSLGSQNVALIADNPSASTTSGIISVGQNTQFQGSGAPNSFVFCISQNGSAENGGSTNAVAMGQSAGALVAYANHGQITLGQRVSAKEVTAYKIVLQNTANVTYDTGLPSTLFSAGPGGGYDILDWIEI